MRQQENMINNKEEIIQKFNEAEYIYIWAYAQKQWRAADWFFKIEKEKLTLSKDKEFFWFRFGYPGPDYNDYYFDDYGYTWAFTKEELDGEYKE